jgi:1-acyl-sn-glycerol-3-phosphate acyltransferase
MTPEQNQQAEIMQPDDFARQQNDVVPTLSEQSESKGKNPGISSEASQPIKESLPQPIPILETPRPYTGPSFFMRWLSYLVLVPLIALATAGFGCISLLVGLWDKSGSQQHAIASAWARTLLLISFSPVNVIGAENLPATAAVYASNHLSYMDTPVLFAKLPFQFRILAKQALWKIPFIGWYLHRSGQVPVDTKSPRSLIASLNRGVATLKQDLPLVLFPEGGRAADGGLQSMMSGCAYMALKAQVPLIPLTLIGTYELLPLHTYALNPRPLFIVVGDPIPTAGLTTRDADALTQRLYQSISTTYMEYSVSS